MGIIYKEVSRREFVNEFKQLRPNNFSDKALDSIYDYLIEQDNYEEFYELDVIALCCDITESSDEDIRKEYSISDGYYTLEYLRDNTSVIGSHTTNGKLYFVYYNF